MSYGISFAEAFRHVGVYTGAKRLPDSNFWTPRT